MPTIGSSNSYQGQWNPMSFGFGGGSNSGQFGNSAYNNPQMSQFGSSWGAPQGSGWFNPADADNQWRQNMQPNQSAWSGPAPGHHGQQYSYNPQTGQGSWENAMGGFRFGGPNPYGHGAVSFTDPNTGMKQINPSALRAMIDSLGGMFQGAGIGGATGYTPTDFEGQSINTPGAYGGFDYDSVGSGIDPSEVIAAQEYKLQEAMEGDMARAGGRIGQSGFAMSTPYANQLGEAARKASQDRNAITLQYQYDAAQQQAARDAAQQLQAAQFDFGGWQQGGNWGMQGQMFDQGQNFQKWLAENQFGMQNAQMQNQYGGNLQQQLLMSIFGGMF